MGPSSDSDKKYFDVAKPRTGNPIGAPSLKHPKRQMINITDDQKPPEESSPKTSTEDDNAPIQDTLIEPDEAFEPADSSSSLSHPELNVPDHIEIDDDKSTEAEDEGNKDTETAPVVESEDIPFVNPLPGTIDEAPAEEASEIEQAEPEAAPEEPVQAAPKEELATQQPEIEKEPLEQTEPEAASEAPLKAAPKEESNTILSPADRFTASDALPDPGQTASDEAKEEMQDPKIFDTKEYYVPIGVTHHSHGGLKMAFAFGILCAVVVVGAILFYVLKIGK